MNICNQFSSIFHPNLLSFVIIILLFLLFIYIFFFKLRSKLKPFQFITLTILGFIAYSFFAFITSIAIFMGYGYDDNPPSARYHELNAMVKLRCFDEPDRKYCPRTAEDVRNIAPKEVKQFLDHAQITYQYYKETNDYSLIVRNDNYLRNNARAVLFDSRLTQAKEYGRKGQDFFDVDIVNNCDGTFRITNPPPFQGPWDKIY